MARQEMINLDTCFLSDTHHLYITTKTCCAPAREWTGVVGKQQSYLVQCISGAQYLYNEQAINKLVYGYH